MERYLIGPFSQVLTMALLPLRGALTDNQLEIVPDAGIAVLNGSIAEVGNFDQMRLKYPDSIIALEGKWVAFPGMIDAHTHLCWSGSRAADYALRLSGKSYVEIAKAGGGILDTVQKTRAATFDELVQLTLKRANNLLLKGVTTIEVKSGYGLSVEDELKILEAIGEANRQTSADLVPTCLAAHVVPPEFQSNAESSEYEYLNYLISELLPEVKRRKLSSRIDIFVEEGAFTEQGALNYLKAAKDMGFDLVIHGDQFNTGAAAIANKLSVGSIDHLEAADVSEIITLANGTSVTIALPGASLGLGVPFAPARKLLDAGNSLAIASDWNPGSAPMGNLLMQAAVLGAAQHLTMAEVWAALTFRAAAALKLGDRGILQKDMKADIIAFQTNDYREVLYRQGELHPSLIIKNGIIITSNKYNETSY
jgi:imidazolonepropionase